MSLREHELKSLGAFQDEEALSNAKLEEELRKLKEPVKVEKKPNKKKK